MKSPLLLLQRTLIFLSMAFRWKTPKHKKPSHILQFFLHFRWTGKKIQTLPGSILPPCGGGVQTPSITLPPREGWSAPHPHTNRLPIHPWGVSDRGMAWSWWECTSTTQRQDLIWRTLPMVCSVSTFSAQPCLARRRVELCFAFVCHLILLRHIFWGFRIFCRILGICRHFYRFPGVFGNFCATFRRLFSHFYPL